MSTLKDNLIAARALIDTPAKWGKGGYEPRPGCYCIMGALGMAEGNIADASYEILEAVRPFIPRVFNRSFVPFNDHPTTTHPMILDTLDRAIAASEQVA